MKSRKILVDASAILAVILEEPEKEVIVKFTEGKELVSVGCLKWEIGNAFSAMLKQKRIDGSTIEEGLSVFFQIPYEIVREDLSQAMRLCDKHNIYAYDAYYIDAAIRNRLPLLSLDKRMNAIAEMENLEIMEV